MLLPRLQPGKADGTYTFYSAASSGASATTLNTLVVKNGVIISWVQTAPSGTPGEWQFNDAVNSGQVLTIGF